MSSCPRRGGRDGLLGRRVDDVQHLAVALERAAEQDEAVLDQLVHDPRVLVPAVLLAQVAAQSQGPPRLAPDGAEV